MQSKIILGTAQMGMNYGINNFDGKIGLDASIEILYEAKKNQVEVLDTAPVYGNAHDVIGAFHKMYPSIKYKVITKIPAGTIPDDLVKIVRKYIREMEVDNIEALLFHSLNDYILLKENIDSLNRVKELKLVKHIGVSIYNNSEIEKILDDELIEIIQLPFNLLDNNSLRGEYIQRLKSKGKIVHTRSAFLQGLFFMNEINLHPELQSKVIELQKIAKNNDMPIEKLALLYCINNNYIDNVVVGVDSIEQLKRNLNFSTGILKNDLIDAIDQLKIKSIEFLNPALWTPK
jgi:aryl-alcohol dehydrogenase-like predicted oxidoreductase